MNTLLSNLIQSKLDRWEDFSGVFKTIFSPETKFPVNVTGLQGALHSFFISSYFDSNKKRLLQELQYKTSGYSSQTLSGNSGRISTGSSDLMIVVPGEREAFNLKNDLESVFEEARVTVIPNWGTLAYRPNPCGSRIFGQRSGAIAKMASRTFNLAKAFKFEPRIFIVPLRVFQTPVPAPEYIRSLIFTISQGQTIDTVKVAEKLISIGYTRVPRVSVPGEFSLRGEVLDIYLPEEEYATRIVFDFDQVESIKTFNPEDQTSISKIEQILIYPMKEVIWNDELLGKLKNIFEDYDAKSLGNDDPESMNLPLTEQAVAFRDSLLGMLEATGQAQGEELFYPMLWDKAYSLLDYMDKDSSIFFFDYDRLVNAQESTFRELTNLYRKSRQELPVFTPDKVTFQLEELLSKVEKGIYFRTVVTEEMEKDQEENKILRINSEPAQSYFGNFNYFKDELTNLQKDQWTVVVFADNENQSLRINEILKDFTDKQLSNPVRVLASSISEGFVVTDLKIRVIQENEIFGRKKYIPKSLHKAKSQVIDTFVELNPGDYVVHVNYGIGIFRGIERVKAMGNERDYIKLEYADEEFVFVPIEQVNLVQRYIGSEGDNPTLDRIGSKSWENRKSKVRKAVEDLAEKLIALYSRRKAAHGFPFPKETEWQTTFEAAFPYEDTPDQITVTEEIKADMEKPEPMDRLVCGDVGYGKTEIAMRAAFKAVMGGKQVAFLAPTTILAEQHFENCLDRFQNFPVKIEHLSRFVSAANRKKILEKLAAGEIDILVGTHAIIQKSVIYKNLGLMIIDEEQRFGVKDKERLKEMKNNIDCLAMSATPIPRTLHMSLLKIRDMSLLTTPPQIRKPIETVVDAYSDDKVAQAIRKEIERGGQVFYLHNRVESLNETRLKLERLMPEMMIEVAHGQMTSDELDDIFRRFKMGGFHILVATTIIENGIDIPNVNTIIIDRADMYGISQLYQLRGRVGRSDKKAYAYLLYPGNKSLSEVAMKRLQVISDFTELGSGFKIAMKDMEIRGAGNLLGRDQSGSVYSVGFDLYVKLLNEAVNRLLSQEDYKDQAEVLMEMEYTGFIPDTYVTNPQTKMEIYKKIAAVQENRELDYVVGELVDRFGPIPDEVSSLLALAEIRILCKKLNVSKIKEVRGSVMVEFAKVSDINVNKVLKLITESAGSVKLDPTKPNMIIFSIGKIGLKEKSEYIREKLEKIA